MKLKIEGMTCGHCAAAVTKVLEAVAGVRRADVNLEAGEAIVEGEPALETLLVVVDEARYAARAA